MLEPLGFPRIVSVQEINQKRSPLTMHARSFWAFLLAACWPGWCVAALDPTDVFQVYGTLSVVRDNNLFREPDVDLTINGIDIGPKSDTVFIKGIGLKLDKTLSRQRLVTDINVNWSTYNKYDQLDYTGGDGRIAWLWQLGDYWNGEAAYRKRRTLGGFADFVLKVKDIVDTDTYTLSAGYLFHPRWRVSADLYKIDASHSAEIRRNLDYDAHAIGAELRYRTPAQNTVALQARRTDRDYPNRIPTPTTDSGNREMRFNAVSTWHPSGATRLDAQVGYVDVNFDTQDQDFSGNTWRAATIWDPTAKLRLSANVFKDIRLYEDQSNSFVKVRGFGLSPIYSVTSKVSLQGDLIHERLNFESNREDKTRLARLGLTYAPIRNVDLSVSYEVGRRRSNSEVDVLVSGSIQTIKFNDYDYHTWFATLRVGF